MQDGAALHAAAQQAGQPAIQVLVELLLGNRAEEAQAETHLLPLLNRVQLPNIY